MIKVQYYRIGVYQRGFNGAIVNFLDLHFQSRPQTGSIFFYGSNKKSIRQINASHYRYMEHARKDEWAGPRTIADGGWGSAELNGDVLACDLASVCYNSTPYENLILKLHDATIEARDYRAASMINRTKHGFSTVEHVGNIGWKIEREKRLSVRRAHLARSRR